MSWKKDIQGELEALRISIERLNRVIENQLSLGIANKERALTAEKLNEKLMNSILAQGVVVVHQPRVSAPWPSEQDEEDFVGEAVDGEKGDV